MDEEMTDKEFNTFLQTLVEDLQEALDKSNEEEMRAKIQKTLDRLKSDID